MRNLLVVSHTPSVNTQGMTEALVRGASHADISDIELAVTRPLESGPEEVLWADGIILGTTENFGYMSGAMKDFFDRIYYPCLEQTESLPYGTHRRGTALETGPGTPHLHRELAGWFPR